MVAWAVVAALASGCATATLDVHRPVPLAIPTVAVALRDGTRGKMSPEEKKEFREIVVRELRRAGIEVVSKVTADTTRVLGTVLEYDGGIRLVRYLTSYGPGTGIVATTWAVAEPHTHDIGRCTIEGSVSMGTFGGSFEDVLEETGRALARFLKGDIQ
jgi:hypothetical protein